MATSSDRPDYRSLIAGASLIGGPLLMAVGDLMHPAESMVPAEQIAIVAQHASRWYTAHLLLFVGLMLFIPGFLALAAITAARKPAAGYAARILILVGTSALAAIFVAEMLVGRFVLDGAATATALLESLFSGPMLAAVGPALLAFFVGTAVFAIPLMRAGGTMGWSAACILGGALLILAEIVSALVILSQLGNVLVFCGSAAIGWRVLHRAAEHLPS